MYPYDGEMPASSPEYWYRPIVSMFFARYAEVPHGRDEMQGALGEFLVDVHAKITCEGLVVTPELAKNVHSLLTTAMEHSIRPLDVYPLDNFLDLLLHLVLYLEPVHVFDSSHALKFVQGGLCSTLEKTRELFNTLMIDGSMCSVWRLHGEGVYRKVATFVLNMLENTRKSTQAMGTKDYWRMLGLPVEIELVQLLEFFYSNSPDERTLYSTLELLDVDLANPTSSLALLPTSPGAAGAHVYQALSQCLGTRRVRPLRVMARLTILDRLRARAEQTGQKWTVSRAVRQLGLDQRTQDWMMDPK